MSGFNFKEWSDLYQADPAAFEAKKDAVLTELIENAPTRSKKTLEHTLFRIRMTRQRTKSPLQSAIEASKLMWEAFGKLREELEVLANTTKAASLEAQGFRNPASIEVLRQAKQPSIAQLRPAPEAKVIPFRTINTPKH